MISVDAKKKENVGNFRNGGREWRPKGSPEPVNVHDFQDKELGKVTPYGVYDVAGGSNGYRTRLWKAELAAPAAETGLQITVCHLPPGTSKWNKIEHRLFSHISMNWRGRPLTSHEVIVQTIAATTTRTGLTVSAELDTSAYPKGINISNRQMKDLEQRVLRRHQFHGEWNYGLIPARGP